MVQLEEGGRALLTFGLRAGGGGNPGEQANCLMRADGPGGGGGLKDTVKDEGGGGERSRRW